MKKYLVLLFAFFFISVNPLQAKQATIIKNKQNQIIKKITYHKNNKQYQIITYSYYKNKKLKKSSVTTLTNKGKKKSYTTQTKNSKGLKNNYKSYSYNKYGKLRTTKKSKAYRKVYTYYSNGLLKQRIIHTYNKKGKLSKKKVKKYKYNNPKYFGQRLVKNAKKYLNNQNMVCSELVEKSLFKTGFKNQINTNKLQFAGYKCGDANNVCWKGAFYYPDEYKYSKVISLKTEKKIHKQNLKNFKKSKIIIAKNQKDLKKKLVVGDIIAYKKGKKGYGYHVAIYLGNGKVIQGGLKAKNGKMTKVGITSLKPMKGLSLQGAIRVEK